jgi:endonuclease/exonuclease/phosphatase family metal-dependent hydrolase
VSSATAAHSVRVASFNIRSSHGHDGDNRWRRRRPACVAAIRGFEADIVGLQEVRRDQLRYLRRAFPDAVFVGRARNRWGGGEHASVLVAPTGWVIESSETRWLSPTPARRGSPGWDAAITRVATLVRLQRDGVRLGIANTHFDHAGVEARERSAELIVEWLGGERDRHWAVLGDLNAVPGSAPLQTLAAGGYADALPPDAGGTEHAFTGAADRTRIDYILAGPGIEVEAAWIGHERPRGRLPSDHWPVLADLVVR